MRGCRVPERTEGFAFGEAQGLGLEAANSPNRSSYWVSAQGRCVTVIAQDLGEQPTPNCTMVLASPSELSQVPGTAGRLPPPPALAT